MPDTDFRLPSDMSNDLAAFVDRARANLADVVKELPNAEPASSPSAFSRHLAKKLGKDNSDIYPVVDVLLNLKRTQAQLGISPAEFVNTISSSIKGTGPPWDHERLETWRSIEKETIEAINDLTPDSGLMISAKISNLAYNRQNILHDSRIISDVRPVFDADAHNIKAMVVTHSLVIRFSNGLAGDIQELHLTLDRRDVAALRDQCNRADAKAERVVEALDDKPWATIVYPEKQEA